MLPPKHSSEFCRLDQTSEDVMFGMHFSELKLQHRIWDIEQISVWMLSIDVVFSNNHWTSVNITLLLTIDEE